MSVAWHERASASASGTGVIPPHGRYHLSIATSILSHRRVVWHPGVAQRQGKRFSKVRVMLLPVLLLLLRRGTVTIVRVSGVCKV